MWGKLTVRAAAGLAVVGALGVGMAAAGVVSLPFSGDGNTINGCYSSGGALKVLTPSQPTCPDGFAPIHWNVTGPPGAPGADGAAGPPGPPGGGGSNGYFYADNDHAIALRQFATNDVAVLWMAPEERYLVTGTTTVWNRMDHAVDVSCGITADQAPFETTTVGAGQRAAITVVSSTPVGLAALDCATFQESTPDVVATAAEMTAVSVASITKRP
jgi:hypothetical protein